MQCEIIDLGIIFNSRKMALILVEELEGTCRGQVVKSVFEGGGVVGRD